MTSPITISSGAILMKYWPLLLASIILIGALYEGKKDIKANAGEILSNRIDIKDNELSIGELENRVTVESAATGLALQRLRLQQEAAITAQASTARRQDDKLDAILRNLTGNE